MPQGGGVGGRNLIIIKWAAKYALIWIFFTSTYPGTTRTSHNIFDPLLLKRGYLWIFLFPKIDQIQLDAKYALMWIKMYIHILWDHPHPPITFLLHLPQKGGNYEFSLFWKIGGGAWCPPLTPRLYQVFSGITFKNFYIHMCTYSTYNNIYYVYI